VKIWCAFHSVVFIIIQSMDKIPTECNWCLPYLLFGLVLSGVILQIYNFSQEITICCVFCH